MSQNAPVDPPRGRAPSPAANGPGRLNLLAELAGRLADAPESPETLQAIVECALRATASAFAELRVEVVSGETLAFHSGGAPPRAGRKLAVRLRAETMPVGELTVYRTTAFRPADRLFLETVATHLSAALGAERLRRAQRVLGTDVAGASPLRRLRSLFGGAAGRGTAGPLARPGREERFDV